MNGTTTRRRFFGGAALLAAPAAAVGAVAGDDVAARLAALEDANAIRALLHDYARHSRSGAAPGIGALTIDSDATIDVAANGTATAHVHCTVESATPIDGNETLVEMARLQGDGVVRRSERRVLTSTFAKHDGIWLLERMELTA